MRKELAIEEKDDLLKGECRSRIIIHRLVR